jgi:predicted  nucleic acid-binding Zn-ribbon protein
MLALQETDCRIRELERMKSDIPARQGKETLRLDEHKKKLAQSEDALKHKHAAARELDVEVQARREKIRKLRTQQFEIKTNKEFKVFEEEIATVNEQINGLEDRELVLMQEIEDARAAVERSRSELKKQEADVQADIEVWNGKLAEIGKELASLAGRRAEQVVGIDAGRLSAYETIFTRRDRAIVPVVDGVCSGCHMNVPRFIVHDARKQAEMVRCTYCGRLLY